MFFFVRVCVYTRELVIVAAADRKRERESTRRIFFKKSSQITCFHAHKHFKERAHAEVCFAT